MTTHQDDALPRFLDGIKFTDWLKSEGVKKSDLTESENRRFWGWEKGCRADVESSVCDTLLTRYLIQNLIPDDCWSANQRRCEPREKSLEIRALLEAGHDRAEVAERLNMNRNAVARHSRRLDKERAAA